MDISTVVENLGNILSNLEEFGVTDSVKSLLMSDPLMAERIEGQTDDEIVATVKELHELAISTEAAETITDPVLGKLKTKDKKYDPDYSRWGTFTILGKKIPIQIIIRNKEITDLHRDSYAWFKKNIESQNKNMRKELTKYAKMVEKDLGKEQYTFNPKHIDELELKKVLLENQKKGDAKVKFVILGECAWDDEHGFGCEVVVDKHGKTHIYVSQYGMFI